jgi:hypothetical protein
VAQGQPTASQTQIGGVDVDGLQVLLGLRPGRDTGGYAIEIGHPEPDTDFQLDLSLQCASVHGLRLEPASWFHRGIPPGRRPGGEDFRPATRPPGRPGEHRAMPDANTVKPP